MARRFHSLGRSDTYVDTSRLTTGIFSNGSGTLLGSSMYTSSISGSNKLYFYNIQDGSDDTTATVRFAVAYGNVNASGSDQSMGVNGSLNETQATYKQYANILLDDPHSKFTFTAPSGSSTPSHEADDVWFISVDQDAMKDEIDTKFTITLSASKTEPEATSSAQAFVSSSTEVFTNYTASSHTGAGGLYYDIVSGSAGQHVVESNVVKSYGHFYPQLGILAFSGTQLSASMNGAVGLTNSGSLETDTSFGFAPDARVIARTLTNDVITAGADNNMKMVKALKQGSVIMRTVQNLNQTIYYCRVDHTMANWSSNPTYTIAGSTTGQIVPQFRGDSVTYVTSVGLHNSNEDLLAVAKVSQPQKKNHAKELMFAVKIDG